MSHRHGKYNVETKNIKVAFLLNVGFVIIEIIGGILTNSVAILSDAAHDLGDSVSLGISWYLQKIAKKKEDDKFTYGYRRYSVLGAIINLVILLVGCIFILQESIPRLFTPEDVNTKGMFFLSIAGIGINFLAMLSLRRGASINERVVSLHFLEDVLGWVAVMIGSIVMMVWDIPIIDPILSICIAVYILYNIIKNSRITLDVILQRTPRDIDLAVIKKCILDQEHIIDAEDIHVWSLDGEFHISTIIIVFKTNTSSQIIDTTFTQLHSVLEKHKLAHVTFEPKFV